MRQRARAALLTISKLPDAERIAAITKLPGLGDSAYLAARAVGQMGERGVDTFIAAVEKQEPALVVELAHLHLAAVGSDVMATPTPPVAPAPPYPEACTRARTSRGEPGSVTPSAPPSITDVMRKHAGAALFALSTLSHAERLAVIEKLPGVGNEAYPIALAVGSLKKEAVESFLDALHGLEPEIIVTLARQHAMNGSAVCSTSAVAEPAAPVASAPPNAEGSTPASAVSEEPGPATPSAPPPITDVMRKHAGAALFALSKLPDADRITAITSLPGVGDIAYPVAWGAAHITEGSLDAFIAGLETKAPEILVELARQHGMNGSAGA